MADKVNAALQIGNVDFHLVTAALLAVDQCTHEVVTASQPAGAVSKSSV